MKETTGTSTSSPCRLSVRMTLGRKIGEDIGDGVGLFRVH